MHLGAVERREPAADVTRQAGMQHLWRHMPLRQLQRRQRAHALGLTRDVLLCHADIQECCGAVGSDPDALGADVEQAHPRRMHLCERLHSKQCIDKVKELASKGI